MANRAHCIRLTRTSVFLADLDRQHYNLKSRFIVRVNRSAVMVESVHADVRERVYNLALAAGADTVTNVGDTVTATF